MAGRSILVVKLSALGDILTALPALQAIRRHHRDDRIVLLTAPPYVELLRDAGVADEIEVDRRLAWWQFAALLRWRRRLRGRFDRVYDLQWSRRSNLYHHLWPAPKPEWVGVAAGASHRYRGRRERKTVAERHRELLALAGIVDLRPANLAFLQGKIDGFALKPPYLLLVPGSSPHRPEKRWPAAHYADLARWSADRGLQPVLLGGPAEADVLAEIAGREPRALDLGGRTSLAQLATLARSARAVVGNDTGPTYAAALAGAPALIFYSGTIDLQKIRPPKPHDLALQREPLADLPLDEAIAALRRLLADEAIAT